MGACPSNEAPVRVARKRTRPDLADCPRAAVAGVGRYLGAGFVALDARLGPRLAGTGLGGGSHGHLRMGRSTSRSIDASVRETVTSINEYPVTFLPAGLSSRSPPAEPCRGTAP